MKKSKSKFRMPIKFLMEGLTPQNRELVSYFRKSGEISQRSALMDLSIQSLTKRIAELRQLGADIAGNFKKHPTTGQRYMSYQWDGYEVAPEDAKVAA